MRLSVCTALLCTVAATGAYASGGLSVSAVVDRGTVSLQEEIVLTVTVDDSRHAQIHLPPLHDFTVHERGQATQVHIVNGAMSTQVSFTYALTPTRVGTFVIGPVTATVGATAVHSEPFEVHITAAAAPASDGGDAFITADISNSTPVVGEQVVYTWRFFRRVHVANGKVGLPDFDGFIAKDLGPLRESVAHIDGQKYTVTQTERGLFPQEAGTFVIPGSRLDIDVEQSVAGRGVPGNPLTDIFGRVHMRSRALTTPPLTVTVQPLPPAPANFSDLVGRYQIDIHLAQPNLQVGDSTTLTMVVHGEGNIDHVVEPSLGDIPGLKVYSERPVVESHIEHNAVVGSKTFKKALVPIRAGDVIVPAISLVYFDPQTHRYETATSEAVTMHIAGNSQAETRPPEPAVPPVIQKADVKLLHDDILPPYRRNDALQVHLSAVEKVGLSLLSALPPLAYGLARLLRRRHLRALDFVAGRRRTALSRALGHCGAMQQALAAGRTSEAAELGSRALRSFLGDRLGVGGLALTPNEARRLLAVQGVPPSLCVTVEGILQRCEAAQYGAANLGTPGGDGAQELRDILHQLHQRLPA